MSEDRFDDARLVEICGHMIGGPDKWPYTPEFEELCQVYRETAAHHKDWDNGSLFRRYRYLEIETRKGNRRLPHMPNFPKAEKFSNPLTPRQIEGLHVWYARQPLHFWNLAYDPSLQSYAQLLRKSLPRELKPLVLKIVWEVLVQDGKHQRLPYKVGRQIQRKKKPGSMTTGFCLGKETFKRHHSWQRLP